jgi:hypothetical protein
MAIVNRSGRHRIASSCIVDASARGLLARMAGIPLTEPQPTFTVRRRVLGGEAIASADDWHMEGTVTLTHEKEPTTVPLWCHTSTASLDDASWAAWMQLETSIRHIAYRKGQQLSADSIEAFTGERLHPEQPPADCAGDMASIPASAITANHRTLWFAGSVGNVDAATRARMHSHEGALEWGRRLASMLDDHLLGTNRSNTSAQPQTVAADPGPLPAMPDHQVDVLVVGGGTGGAPAAIAAARNGARTLCTEFLAGLGGVGTLGLIGRYWFGNRVGFTNEIDRGAAALTNRSFEDGSWDVEAKMQWYQTSLSNAGGQVWYRCQLVSAVQEGRRVCGAVIATPQGPVRIAARCTVDATGSAAVAASAGAATVDIGSGHLALQGTGLPGRDPGKDYTNTDYDFIDDTDAGDVASAHVTARKKFQQAFDAGQLVDSRERRRIVGDYEVTPMDIRLARVFPDTVVKARSNFDTHGFTVHPLFLIVPPGHDPLEAYVPLRALLPRDLDGILVTGLGISAHRDAMPVIRMQADVQNQGYAAGYIASMCGDGNVRGVDIGALQKALVSAGILDPEIAGAADSFPLSGKEIDAALQACVDEPDHIDRLFTLPEYVRNARLRKAFASSTDIKAKRFFAFVLGVLWDASGAETLAAEVAATPWDDGWDYTGMGQFGASMSPLDARIIALGRCRRTEHLPVIAAKAAQLPAEAAFSHYRALAEAVEHIASAEGAAILASLLQRPGICGHAVTSMRQRASSSSGSATDTAQRNRALIELHLAAACIRVQPEHPLATSILTTYATDVRGLFARFARSLLPH